MSDDGPEGSGEGDSEPSADEEDGACAAGVPAASAAAPADAPSTGSSLSLVQAAGDKALDATAQRFNSHTHRKDYAAFVRQCANKRTFPVGLTAAFKSDRIDLFNEWMKCERDWRLA